MKRLIWFLQRGIWQIRPKEVSPVKYLLLEILKKLLLTIRFFTTKRVMQKASALTYSTLLAIVPIMAVVFAMRKTLIVDPIARYVTRLFLTPDDDGQQQS